MELHGTGLRAQTVDILVAKRKQYIMVYYLIIGAYIILYIGMILYDLLHKDPTEVQPKQEEEEIDITQEAQQFKPVEASKEMPNIQKPATAEEQPKAETPEKADSSKAETPKEEKPAAPDNTHETPEKDDSPKPDSQPTQEPPSKPQPAPSQPAQEPKADAKKDDDESSFNETEYSGAKKFEDLEQEIIACSKDDPEMQAAAYEIMRIDSEQA